MSSGGASGPGMSAELERAEFIDAGHRVVVHLREFRRGERQRHRARDRYGSCL